MSDQPSTRMNSECMFSSPAPTCHLCQSSSLNSPVSLPGSGDTASHRDCHCKVIIVLSTLFHRISHISQAHCHKYSSSSSSSSKCNRCFHNASWDALSHALYSDTSEWWSGALHLVHLHIHQRRCDGVKWTAKVDCIFICSASLHPIYPWAFGQEWNCNQHVEMNERKNSYSRSYICKRIEWRSKVSPTAIVTSVRKRGKEG